MNRILTTNDRILFQRKAGGIQLEAPGTHFGGYDPTTKDAVFNEFSTAGFRIGHTLIREAFSLGTAPRRSDIFTETSAVDFFQPSPLHNVSLGVNPYTGFYVGLVFDRAFDFDA